MNKMLKQNWQCMGPYEKAAYFLSLVKEEVETCETFLTGKESETLKQYYPIKNTDFFKFCQHRYAERMEPLIRIIEIGKMKKVLDAGCGTGSVAILCGILGADVTGIDISEERLNVAKKRIKYYGNKMNTKINVKFFLENILKHSGEYDVIWCMEAITHIDPVDEFLHTSYKNLRNNGRIIITDPNALNPYIYLQTKKEQKRKGGIYTTKKDPKTGEEISYAVERVLTIPAIKKGLIKNGFKIEKVYLNAFFPFFIFNRYTNLCKVTENILKKVAGINYLCGGYTVIGVKIDS